MGIKDGELERIKEGSRLEDLVSRDVSETEPSGDGFMCSSPFRSDRNPSFFVSQARQFWHDFGTNESGDVVAYVRKRDGCGFIDALKTLCDVFGLRPIQWESTGGFDPDKYAARRQILEIACDYWEKMLWSEEHEPALEAMKATHGLNDKSLKKYRAGYADGKLHLHIQDCFPWQFSTEELLSTGLFYQRADGLHDVFDRRGVFPYLRNNQAEFFIARRYEGVSHDPKDKPWEAAKYKKLLTHSAKYPFVMEGALHPLFGLDTVRVAKKDDILVVTEGVTDAISAMEAGLKVISPVTVAFRKQDYEPILRIAQRFERVVIFNDLGDREDSGKKGAVKTAIYLHTNGVDVRLVNAEALGIDEPTKGNKVDLNSFFVDKGAAAVQVAVKSAPTLPDFLIGEIPESMKEDPARLVQELEPVFMLLKESSDIVRDLLTKKVSKRFGIKNSVVEKQVKLVSGLEEPEPKAEEPYDPFAEAEVEDRGFGGKRATEKQEDEAVTRGEVIFGHSCYYGYVKKKGGDGDFVYDGDEEQDKGVERISNFVFEPHQLLVQEDRQEELSVYFRLEGQQADQRLGPIAVPAGAWSSIAKMREFYSHFGKYWFNGTSDNVSFLKAHLAFQTEEVVYTRKNIGYTDHEGERYFLWPGGVMDANGVREDVNLRWHDEPNPLASELRLREEQDEPWSHDQLRELAQKVLPLLLKLNKPSVMYTLLGWTYACAFSPEIKKRLGMFPILWMWATQGAGKTTLGGLVSRLTGKKGGMKPVNMSSFALTKELDSSDCIPVELDEYRDDQRLQVRNNLLEKLRITANADSTLAKGTASQQLKMYKISRPVLIGGESPPNDAATKERCLICNPSKKDVSVERQLMFEDIFELPLWRLAASWYQYGIDKNVEAHLEAARAELLTLEISAGIKGKIPIRNRNGLTVMLFGLNQLQAWADTLGVQLDTSLNTEVFTRIVATCLSAEGDLEIGADGTTSLPAPKTSVSVFLEALHTMAIRGALENRSHYKVSDDGEFLYFHFKSVYSEFKEFLRRTGEEDEVRVGKNALRAAMREEEGEDSLIVSVRASTSGWSDGVNQKVCIKVSLAKFKEYISDEKFPGEEGGPTTPEIVSSKGWGSN